MKKGLLFICGLFLALFTNQAYAQDFDLDFYQYFEANKAVYNKSTAKDAANIWKGQGEAGAITINGIKAWVDGGTRWSAGDESGPDGTPYVRMQNTNDAGIIYITSDEPLVTIAFQYRGTTDTGNGAVKITYGTDDLSTQTYYFPPFASSTAPGTTAFFRFDPADEIKWIKVQRGTNDGLSTGSSVNTKFYRVAVSTTDFTSLPLELLSFTAKPDAFGKSVNLNWKTTNEVNTKDFSIERRTDNTDFVSIGTRNSKNIEGVNNYSFTDNDPVSGNAYYRLKQTDNDGKFTYSDIVSVNVTGGTSVSVYPNPTTDALNVGHGAGSNGSLNIFDLQGKSMISQALTNGATNTAVNVANLTPGTYVLSVQNAGQQSTVKFVKK